MHEKPLRIYADDFDNNGFKDIIVSTESGADSNKNNQKIITHDAARPFICRKDTNISLSLPMLSLTRYLW